MRLTRVGREEWIEQCGACALTSIYQDPRWLELIEDVYPRLSVVRCACWDDSGQLAWLLPLVQITPLLKLRPMLISLPFGNYGGFLLPKARQRAITDDDLQTLGEYFQTSRAFALEIRELEAPAHSLRVDDQFERYEVPIPRDEGALWTRQITGNARTSVRKADKLGVEIVFDAKDPVQALQDVYELQASHAGTPIHHVSWYRKLIEQFSREQQTILARYKGEFVGAALLLNYERKSILHMAVTSPLHREAPIADKLYWTCLKWILDRDLSDSLDFGRTRSDPGQRFFKRKWGGIARPIYYSYLLKPGHRVPQILPHNPRFQTPIRAWQRLPMGLKRRLGPHLRVRIPT